MWDHRGTNPHADGEAVDGRETMEIEPGETPTLSLSGAGAVRALKLKPLGIPHADGGTGRGLPESFCPKPRHPGNQGFDEWFSAGNWYDIGHEHIYHNGEQVPPRKGDTADVLPDVALEWIGRQAAKRKPFLAAIWFPSPHGPHRAAPEDAAVQEPAGPTLGSIAPTRRST